MFGPQINEEKTGIAQHGQQKFWRYALKTPLVLPGDDLETIVDTYARPYLKDQDVLFLSEKMVACAQGRAIPVKDIKPGFFAKLLCRFVYKSPHGIGLASPETMEMAIQECGLPRILLAAVCGGLGKLLGRRGWFYQVAGYKEISRPPSSAATLLVASAAACRVPGFDAKGLSLTVSLTRVMLWQSLFLALAAMGMGLLHTYNRYGPPAWGSLVYNLATVALGAALASRWGIYGFGAGVVLGAVLYLLAEVPSLYRLYHGQGIPLDLRHAGVSTAARRTLPVLLGLSVQQINLIVSQNLASFLQPGAISALRQAQRLMQLPIGVFAIPLSVSLFAAMSRAAAQSDRQTYLQLFHQGVERILFFTLPAAAGLALLAQPLVALLYQRGAFDAQDSKRTALLLCLYCIGLACYGLTQLLNRAFYAQEDTKTPLVAAALAVAANLLLSLGFFRLWQEAGLALAYSLAGFCHLGLLAWLLRRTQGRLGGKRLCRAAAQPLLLTAVMSLVLLAFNALQPWGNSTAGLLCQALVGTALGGGVYLGGHWLLGHKQLPPTA